MTIKLGAADCGRGRRPAKWLEDHRTTSSGLGSSATTVESARITPCGDQRELSAIAAQTVAVSRKSWGLETLLLSLPLLLLL